MPCKILIADDDPDFVDCLSLILRMDGHEVVAAGDGFEALKLLDLFGPTIALLDIAMPRMDGYEVARRVRAGTKSHTVLVAMTGCGRREDIELALGAGFDHHLLKPVEPADLQSLVARVTADRE